MQKGAREHKHLRKHDKAVGFAVYSLSADAAEFVVDGRLTKEFFVYNGPVAQTTFIPEREVVFRAALPPGEYCVIPSSFDVGQEGDFVLRMFTDKLHTLEAMDTPTEIKNTVGKDKFEESTVTLVVTNDDSHASEEEKKPEESNSLKESTVTLFVTNDDSHSSEEENKPEESKNAKAETAVDNDFLDATLKPAFVAVRGEDGGVNSFELQIVANVVFKKALDGGKFSLETCRSIVAFMDADRSGELNYVEFRKLFATLMKWIAFFKAFSGDNSSMDVRELRTALGQLGLKVSTSVVSSIVLRYADRKGGVGLDDFVQICCRLNTAFRSFSAFRGENLDLDKYIMCAMYT